MARCSITGFESTLKMLDQLGDMTEAVAVKAVEAAGDLLEDAVRNRLEGRLATSKHRTGDLEAGFGATPARLNDDGTVDVKVGFFGYDRKGVSNQLKARVMESGSSKQKKRPFFRPAVTANRKKIQELMERIVYINLERIQKG